MIVREMVISIKSSFKKVFEELVDLDGRQVPSLGTFRPRERDPRFS